MRKLHELTDPKSCMSKAQDDEMVFVLRAKDEAGPDTIRYWVKMRIALGLNTEEDAKIQEALGAAETMERTRHLYEKGAK